MPRAELFRHEAAEQIQLVRRRHCDQQVGAVDAGLQLCGRHRPVALDAEDVQILHRLLQRHGVLVDDGDLVALPAELLGQCGADLPVADNDNFHTLATL